MDSSLYDLLKFLHVLAAVVWIGGSIMLQFLIGRARRSTDPGHLRELMGDIEVVGSRVFGGASLVLVIAGFGLIGKGEWDFDPWIIFGLAVWAVSFVIGIGFYGRAVGRIGELLREHAPDAPPVRAELQRYLMVAGIETLLLVLVIADMVVKPGL